MRRQGSAALVAVLVAGVLAVLAPTAFPAARVACSDALSAADAYAAAMAKARTAYFKTHKSSAARKTYVAAQKAKLTRLRAAATAACTFPPVPAPIVPPAPSANEHFVFSDEISQSTRDEVEGYVTFAVQDEQTLLGVQLDEVTVFVSTDAAWLAQHQCGFYGRTGDCVASTQTAYEQGNSSGNGPRAVFVNWKSDNFQAPSPTWIRQKIVAHEVFGMFEHQLDHQDGDPGPYWLYWGAQEMIGYRVAADRNLQPYANTLITLHNAEKMLGYPPSEIATNASYDLVGHYWLAGVADHLVNVAPGGVRSLAAYWTALGGGAAWSDAFASAFGLTPDAFDANFADYRKGL
jgi:cobalamin synthase